MVGDFASAAGQRSPAESTADAIALRPAYRSDIDGLRAIAVIPVVIYHAGLAIFPGGFVGVDVFFVISGYLITSILAMELAAGQYSITNFYARRLRRLLPALAVLLILCSIVSTLLFMPHDLKEFGQSAVATALSASNIYFWLKTGYFDPDAVTKPLLHTWSLAVEDQYYLIFPILMLGAARVFKRHWRYVIGLLFAVSLLFSAVEVSHAPTAAFYLLPARMWELLLGSLLAIRPLPAGPRWLREALAGLGLALIGFAVFCFDTDTVFPGLNALVPCVGALLVIHASPRTFIAKLLSLRPLVWIGLISYSLYLYHWPVIVYAKYFLLLEPDQYRQIAFPLCIVSVGLAYLSYRYVETPFRRGAALETRRSLFLAAATAMGFFVCFGLAADRTLGFPQRLSADVRAIAAGALDTSLGRDRCDGLSAADILGGNACGLGRPAGPPSFAVFGDSFAEAVLPGIDALAVQRGEHGASLVHSGCYPLVGVSGVNLTAAEDESCRTFIDASVRYINQNSSIGKIILVGRWSSAAEGTRFGAQVFKDWYIVDQFSKDPGYDENRAVLARGIERTVAAFAGRAVYVVADIPEQPFNVPQAEALCRYLGKTCPGGVGRADFDRRQAAARRILAVGAEQSRYRLINIGERLCSSSECPAVSDGVALYSDDNHLSRAGALLIQDAFDPIFPERLTATGSHNDYR
jgi:peptidoglycan/LPS O-acetylase OafA/YrhL